MAFNSFTGFHLPNAAERSPDAAWISQARWDALTPEEKEGFAPICPDFVLELRSPSNNLEPSRAKMREYMENQARLGWLIDQKNKKVEIYRRSGCGSIGQSYHLIRRRRAARICLGLDRGLAVKPEKILPPVGKSLANAQFTTKTCSITLTGAL